MVQSSQDAAGQSPFRGIQVLEPEQHVPSVKTPTPAVEVEVRAFYYDKQAQVYKQVEGPTLVDTAKGGFLVDPFDPTRDDPPFETFKELPSGASGGE